MITLAALIAVFGGGGEVMARGIRKGLFTMTVVFHVVILSLGIGNGGDRTLFICYMCWAWTYLFRSTQTGDIAGKGLQDSRSAMLLGVVWWLSILGTAIWSAAKNTHDPVDNWSLCVFGLVTTVVVGLRPLIRLVKSLIM